MSFKSNKNVNETEYHTWPDNPEPHPVGDHHKDESMKEFKSFSNRFRNSDTIRIKDQKEYKRIMKYLDKKGYPYYDIGYGKGEWHIQFDNTETLVGLELN